MNELRKQTIQDVDAITDAEDMLTQEVEIIELKEQIMDQMEKEAKLNREIEALSSDLESLRASLKSRADDREENDELMTTIQQLNTRYGA